MKLKQLLRFVDEDVAELVCVDVNGGVLCTIYNPTDEENRCFYNRFDEPLMKQLIHPYMNIYNVKSIRTRNGLICFVMESTNENLFEDDWMGEF